MHMIVSVTRDDARIVVAALAHLDSQGLERALREDAVARQILVGSMPWQDASAYPSRAEIPIALNAWIRASSTEGAVALAMATARLNITLAALTRFALASQPQADAAMADAGRMLGEIALSPTATTSTTPGRIARLRGALIARAVGRAIAR